MVDGQPATQALVGQQIKHDGTINPVGTSVWTVDSVDLTTDNGPTYQAMNAFPNTSLTTQGAQCATTGCDQSDFDYNGSCGSQHLVPAPGGTNSWNTWLPAQYNAFSGNAGCYQFGAIQNYIGQQLAAGVFGPNHPTMAGQPYTQLVIDRKQAKSDWAACMQQQCAGGPQNGC